MSECTVQLEPLKDTHASELFNFLQPEVIYTYIPEHPPETVSALENRYRFMIKGPKPGSSEEWFNWVLREEGSRQAVGVLQATLNTNEKKASIAYVLFPEQWGKGYAHEGIKQMMSLMSDLGDGLTFVAEIDSRNERSLRLIKRLGFKYAGIESTDEGEDHIYIRR